MKVEKRLVDALRELTHAVHDLAAVLRSCLDKRVLERPSRSVDSQPWSDTDAAYAQAALRPLDDKTPEERNLFERMRRRDRNK